MRMSLPELHGSHIHKHDVGLTGSQGAEVVLRLLRTNQSVKHLILGHNRLGDDGCVLLFDYLRSETGRRHQISEISVNANGIGDAGLWAIARYLEDNKSLKALFLQNNSFQGGCPVMLRFALAVSRSNLHTLSLTCNPSLAEAISSAFLPNLSSPFLSELHLSMCSLGSSATPALISYLASPRSHSLQTLKLNGNPLGLESSARIVDVLERTNWSICWLELYACSHNGPADDQDWTTLAMRIRINVLERNRFLRKKVEKEAFALLPCARALLLEPARHHATPPRTRIPTELLLYILSFVAPSLSVAQLLRVSTYASSTNTLPSISLTLRHDRFSSSSPSSSSSLRFYPHTCIFPTSHWEICAACVRRQRITSWEQERKAWLATVGCDRYDATAFPVMPLYEQEAEKGTEALPM